MILNFEKKVDCKTELLSGFTVALALVPEAVAFAIIAGLPPLTGLYSAFVIGVVTSIFGGRPGMISGATGAVAVVIASLVKSHGIEYVYATITLAGILQMSVGFLKLGKLIRLVPQSAIYGFVNGLAIIIFVAQINQFKDSSGHWMMGQQLWSFLGLVLLTMLMIWQLPRLSRAIPASLVSILVVFITVMLFGIDTKTVGDIASIDGIFPPFHIADIPFTSGTLKVIFPYACIVAGVGLVESLLTLGIVDEMTRSRGFGNREALAQGGANILSGLFSGMGGCAMIGQSLINISSGARARLSGMFAALMLLCFILFGSSLVESVPMAALTGVMIMVAIGTFEWMSFRILRKMPKSDIFVMVVVTVVTVASDNLALAVIIGVIISALVFAWDNAKRIRAGKYIDEKGVKHYEIYGPLFFGSTTAFSDKFDAKNDPKEVVIDFSESRIVDMSAIDTLNKLTERYTCEGKKIHLTHLSVDCRKLLNNAEQIIKVNLSEDPTYKVMTNTNLEN